MTSSGLLGIRLWTELDERHSTVVVPLGAIEQHGPHLPLDTDIRIATAVAEAAAPRFGGLIAPGLSYGASGEHEGFPGTISLGHDALTVLLLEYGRSACRWARRLLFVNGHGGNVRTLRAAVSKLRQEGRDVAWIACAAPDYDAHAGHAETSLLMHIAPLTVRTENLKPGNTTPVAQLMKTMVLGGVGAVSANGVLGDPMTASAAAGREMFESLTDDVVAAVQNWQPDVQGRLQ
ncbi:mycofactocin biosynthesis peptidyl-dipeptidase MftE [Jongsikchunia kroppenstedtii]|uniref:mycofactocin biosynthesis peptidyl-dipeptidase MftE n=1 Tax=Jongsikchunia kroppenstedtii TaxID=1121721 RepID=UPI000360B6C4|nr:mycofactocin biosynthesis peptidyl-dipeptidase MftE [Jongsikchunia kroppenstedtii]